MAVCFRVLLFTQGGREPGEHLKVRMVREVPKVEEREVGGHRSGLYKQVCDVLQPHSEVGSRCRMGAVDVWGRQWVSVVREGHSNISVHFCK